MARPTTPISLSPEQNELLQSIIRSREVPHSLALRARIVLAAKPRTQQQGHRPGIGPVRRDGGFLAQALGPRQRGPGAAGAKTQTVSRGGQRAAGRQTAPGLSRHVHAGADLPDLGGGLRTPPGTPEPLDVPGTGPGSDPPGHRGTDFRDQHGSFFKTRGISSPTGSNTG